MRRTPTHFALLALLALAWPSSGESQVRAWRHEITRGPFRFHANFPLDRYRPLFDELARLPDQVTARLRIAPPKEMVDVYLFGNREIYEMYMRQYFPRVAPRRAMFIKVSGPGNVFAYLDRGFDIDLRHECTHAILHASLPLVPLWLDEGLAEYFEVPEAQRECGHPHLEEIQRHLRWRRASTLTRLEGIASLDDMGTEEYRDAWAWVHLMMHGPPEAQRPLLGFMADLNEHIPPQPLSARFASQRSDPEAMFEQHFRQMSSSRRALLSLPSRR